jgi:hypothetical protein
MGSFPLLEFLFLRKELETVGTMPCMHSITCTDGKRSNCNQPDAGKVIYVCHPYRSDPKANQTQVAGICRHLVRSGHLPLAPHVYLPAFLDEATERSVAMELCLRLVGLAEEIRVYGKPSEGMRLEIAEAYRRGLRIIYECRP